MTKQAHANIDTDKYPHINRGLDGIIAFSSTKSAIDGEKGELNYAGYNIDTLAENASFEEVAFLLWNDRLPKADELEELNKQLRAERDLPEPVLEYIRTTDKNAEPMSVLRTATSMLADFDDEATDNSPEANMRKSIRMTARMPAIIAAFSRVRDGKEIVAPLKEGSIAYDFLYMLNGERPGEKAEKVMDICLILHAEHGMNASTFVCRAICSTESEIYSGVTGACGSLKGPLHGGANTAVMNMLLNLDKDADVEAFIRERLAERKKVMGFGHRVYRTIDPRAKHLQKMSKQLAEETDTVYLYEWSDKIQQVMKDEKNIDPNVDFFSATVYYSMGIKPDLFTCIFAMSRVTGWTAHFMEQAENNRLIRPRQLYVGEKNQPWTPIEKR
ncbi:citrate/2-methylcitrate synthase [Natronogracilivirga saccharolytica]|uniref:Citrate synthase n=1 Tax=Natronogracilivirga saccharolytica TaxID=2812953 RepID=A0A8J7RTA0_9BACT|nr:citrate/2-methylcitrate synthase [Natronogracilivirga saccharolytica]MBP3192552.1 citrate synthase [Natronogracilivirga saccharolytica]